MPRVAARIGLILIAGLCACRSHPNASDTKSPGTSASAGKPPSTPSAASRQAPEKRALASPVASRLPKGIEKSCYLSPCEFEGDFDADGSRDTVLLVARGSRRGLAIIWGSGAAPTIIGAAHAFRVIRFSEPRRDSPRSAGRTANLDVDFATLHSVYALSARTTDGGRVLVDTRRHMFVYEVPGVRGDGLMLDGGDAAVALYRSGSGDWYFVNLGF